MTADRIENAEDLFPRDVQIRRAKPSVNRKLEPWHKPRKQWIRTHQWASAVGRLMDDLQLSDRPFKYLTLPGKDMFDIRVLHETCQQRGVTLKYLGFDTARDTNVNLAADEVDRLPFVHKGSAVYGDSVERVAEKGSLAHGHAAEYCGFDAINLDFCGSVGGAEAGGKDTSLAAIKSFLELQTAGRTEPWILFVTTRCNYGKVTQSVRSRLAKCIMDNSESSDGFRNRVTRSPFCLDDDVLRKGQTGKSSISNQLHLYLFGVGIAKWLVRMSVDAWVTSAETSVMYRVRPDTPAPDMLSLAFRFERVIVPIHDDTGLVPAAQGKTNTTRPTEEEMAIRVLEEYSGMTDIDVLLHEDSKLQNSMVQANARLMSQARYDFDTVVTWGRENCWQPDSAN